MKRTATLYNLREQSKMITYKARLFYYPIVSPNSARGEIMIRKGSKSYILDLLEKSMDKCGKIIIEVAE